MKRSNSYGYGDHFVHIKVKIPKYQKSKHSKQMKHLLKISFCQIFISNLSLKQYSLIKSFAELEEWTPGTVKGVEKKQSIFFLKLILKLYFIINKFWFNF